MIHEISLAEYIDHGRASVRPVGRSLSRADLLLLARGESPWFDCDCPVCRGFEEPPDFLRMVREDKRQLELWPKRG